MKIILLLAFNWLIVSFACAQNMHTSLNSSGGNTENSNGSVSYSIGQIFSHQTTDDNHTISEGIQQAYEISIIQLSESETIHVKVNLYPNPTSGVLNIIAENNQNKPYKIKMINEAGSLIRIETMSENSLKMDISRLEPAMYILRVTDSQGNIQSFKIIKTQR